MTAFYSAFSLDSGFVGHYFQRLFPLEIFPSAFCLPELNSITLLSRFTLGSNFDFGQSVDKLSLHPLQANFKLLLPSAICIRTLSVQCIRLNYNFLLIAICIRLDYSSVDYKN